MAIENKIGEKELKSECQRRKIWAEKVVRISVMAVSRDHGKTGKYEQIFFSQHEDICFRQFLYCSFL